MFAEWVPFDEQHAHAQLAGVRALAGAPGARVLDLGCGDGRVLVPLAHAGCRVVGVDRDGDAVAACEARAADAGVRARVVCSSFDDFFASEHGPFDAVLCLGNTLMEVTEHDALREVFSHVASVLDTGRFVIDDFPFAYWEDVANGNWQEGISEDGSMQLLWQPGEPIFTLREGSSVDPGDDAAIGAHDRLFRLWSMSELVDAAAFAGLCTHGRDPAHHLVWFSRADR